MREITIPDDVYDRLKADAHRQQRSVDDHLRMIIEHAFPTREDALMRLRIALSDDLEPPDTEALPPELWPHESPVDHEALRASMPILDPSLSVTIVNDRDDRV